MAVVQVIENGGARLEVMKVGEVARVLLTDSADGMGVCAINLDADDLKALIKRCRTVLAEIEG